jgi:GABA(A) receptor-associated protein
MAIFIFINNTLPMSSMSMGEVYVKYKDADGVLRMNYAAENTFG